MEQIELNGRKYPFLVSAAASKELTLLICEYSEKAGKAIEEGEKSQLTEKQREAALEVAIAKIDMNLLTLHRGLQHGRAALPWYRRFYLIPSRKRLELILSADEADEIIQRNSLPKNKKGDVDEKKS